MLRKGREKRYLIILIMPLILFSWVKPTRTPFPQQSGTAMTFGCFYPVMNPIPPVPDYGKLYAIFPRWDGYRNRFCSWDCSQNVYPGVWDTALSQLPTTTGYPGPGATLCYFPDWTAWESFIFCLPGLGFSLTPRNEFWGYHIEGRTWHRLPDVPNPSTTIGYGSDMCLGRIVHNIYPDQRALEIYVLKGTSDPYHTNNEFYVFYFPLGIPVAQKLQLMRNYPEMIWRKLADFPHGPNAQMTFVPQDTAIYAFRGIAGGDNILFRYSIRENVWQRVSGETPARYIYPALKTFGVIGNSLVWNPFEEPLLTALRGGGTKHYWHYWIRRNTWNRYDDTPVSVGAGNDLAFGYWKTFEGRSYLGMWAFFGNGDTVVGFQGYCGGEEGSQGNTHDFVFKNINQLFKFIKQNPVVSIQIYNSLGNLVISSGEEIIKLKKGIYYYRIISKEEEKRGKLIIQN